MSGAKAHDQKGNIDKIEELEARVTAAEAAVDAMYGVGWNKEGQEHKKKNNDDQKENEQDVLGRAIEQQHSRIYGNDEWKPKMHYAMHLPHQLLRDKIVLDCFVVERSHQLPKLLAASVQHQ